MKVDAAKQEARLAAAYVGPACVAMALITAYPILYGVWMAFTDFGPKDIRTQHPHFVGLANFQAIFTHAPYLNFDFLGVLGFNLVWTFSNLVFHVGVGVGLALLLNRPGLRFKKFYRAALILPWAVPTYVTALVWHNMFDPQFGALNLMIGDLDRRLHAFAPALPHLAAVDWLGRFPEAFYAALLTNVWLGFPFMMMVAAGALVAIPGDQYEAAVMDGANAFQRFLTVTVPGLRPAMVPAIMLGFIWTFNNFNVIYFVTEGKPFGRTEILVTQAYKLVDLGLYGVASAFALIIFGILIAFTAANMRLSRVAEADA